MKDFGLKDPERTLGTVKWPEFAASVGEEDQGISSRVYTVLCRLSGKYEGRQKDYARHMNRDPNGLSTKNPPKEPDEIEQPFMANAKFSGPSDEVEIDLDNLYIYARTGRLDRAQGMGEKTLGLVTGLINEQIDAQTQTAA